MCSQYFDHIWLMTRYPADTQTVVNDNEIVIIGDPNGDLNSSLNLVAEDMASIANLVAVITADLPLLRSDDLRRLLTSCEDGNAVIAPSKDVGTSGILIPVESCSAFREFHFAFGEKSFDKHVKAFSRANLNYRVVRTSGFIWDLDDVDDIEHILRDENNRLPVSLQKILDNLLKVDKNQ